MRCDVLWRAAPAPWPWGGGECWAYRVLWWPRYVYVVKGWAGWYQGFLLLCSEQSGSAKGWRSWREENWLRCPHSPCLPKASPCCWCLRRLFGRQAAGTSPASTQGFPLGAFCWQDAHCNVWFCKRWMHCKRLMCHLDLSQLLVTGRISSCNLWVSTRVSSDFAIWVTLLLKLGVSNKLNKTMKTCFLR